MLVFDLTLSNVTLRGECVVNLRQFNTRFEGEGEGGEGGGGDRTMLAIKNQFFFFEMDYLERRICAG